MFTQCIEYVEHMTQQGLLLTLYHKSDNVVVLKSDGIFSTV